MTRVLAAVGTVSLALLAYVAYILGRRPATEW